MFSLSSPLLLDDDLDEAHADDFDIDFDEDYECLSDEEFEIVIDYDDYDSDDFDVLGDEFCLGNGMDAFGDFDPDELLSEKDDVDEE